MRFKRIYLGDFSLFQNQTMGPLNNGLIVIGGLNRAGKTTLMTALRYLGYGIPKGQGIPPAVRQHEIRADVESNGYNYHVFLSGHGNPRVTAVDQAPELTAADLYNNLDRFTYNQIFTISLDELRQLPENIDNKDQEKVWAVLLGAGWGDALALMQLKDRLSKEATNLGGKNGSINTKKFQPYYDMLCDGLALRDRANEQMDQYEEKCSRLAEIDSVLIPTCEARIKEGRKELQRLELLRECYHKYEAYRLNKRLLETEENRHLLETYPRGGLEQALIIKKQYEAVLSNEKTAQESFSVTTAVPTRDGAKTLQQKLLDNGVTLDKYASRLSGWEARIQAVKTTREELIRNNNELRADLKELYGGWEEGEGQPLFNSVKADQINEHSLQKTVLYQHELQSEMKQKKRELVEMEGELEEKTNLLKSLPSADKGLFKRVAWLAAANVLVTVYLSFILPPGVAIASGITAAVAVLAYFLKQNSFVQTRAKQAADLEKEINDSYSKKQVLMTRYEEVSKELEAVNKRIEHMIKDCNIPDAVDVAYLPEFVRRIRQLQRLHGQIYIKNTQLIDGEQELVQELSSVVQTLKSLGLLPEQYGDVIGEAPTTFNQLHKSISYLNAARELQTAINRKLEVEKNILQLLEEEDASVHEKLKRQPLLSLLDQFMERGQRYGEVVKIRLENDTLQQILLSNVDTEKWRVRLGEHAKDSGAKNALMAAFAAWCEEFASVEEIKEKHVRIGKEIVTLERELEYLRGEQRDIKREVDELSSDSNLLEARKQIDTARNGLTSILENYAVHRIAAYMLERVQEQILEKTRDQLLAPAGKIFSAITGESYESIELPWGSEPAAFKARLANGNEQNVHVLSRATREQLFFSIRLSRIRAIKPELPVILDDTFANFDPVHTREAVKCLLELAQTHQVFVLTCHTEFLECLHSCIGSFPCQFWGLETGRFTGPYNSGSEISRLLTLSK